jgi:hypothetical protein
MIPRRSILMAGVSMVGCQATNKPALPPPIPPKPLHLLPLTDLVALPNLDWLVHARPQELLRKGALEQSLFTVFPKAKVKELSTYLGFDLLETDELVIANYGETQLYLMHVAYVQSQVETQFAQRVTSQGKRSNSSGQLIRISGIVGRTHRAFASLQNTVLAYEIGPTGPLKIAVAFAREKLKKTKPALQTTPLKELEQALGTAPFRLFAPNTAKPDWTSQAAHGLLPRILAAGLSATPSKQGLNVRVGLLGLWEQDPPTEALSRLEHTVQDLQRSSLGRLTGIHEPKKPFRFGGNKDFVFTETTLDPVVLAQGLKDITSSELRDLFPKTTQQRPEGSNQPPDPAANHPKLLINFTFDIWVHIRGNCVFGLRTFVA